jgi:hypothetical protein
LTKFRALQRPKTPAAPSRPAQRDDDDDASGLVVDPALFAKAEAIIASIRMAP